MKNNDIGHPEKILLIVFCIFFGSLFQDSFAQVVTPDFSFTQNCEEVTFQNLSSATGGLNITGYLWEFGDAGTSTLVNPSHTYAGDGDYEVVLTVFHDGPGQEQTSQIISVWTPVADFTFEEVCLGEPTSFTSTATTPPNSNLTAWEWDFDNDGTFDATGINVSYTYSISGPKTVVLQVTNDLGCQKSISKNVNVKATPQADFTADPVCFGLATQFMDASTTPNGSISEYRWDFDGDGTFDAFVPDPSYLFPSPGIFPVTLEVENSVGCTHDTIKEVEVFAGPESSFSISPGCPLEMTSFSDESTAGSAAINFWEWNFGDGSPVSNGQNPTHTYLENGEFEVQLLIMDENGCQDDTVITLVQQKPDAGFQFESGCLGIPTQFDDTSTFAEGYPVISWDWDFGDGGSASIEDPSYTYATPGLFDVELIVGNIFSCFDTAYATVLVDTLPEAFFSFDAACQGLPTCFTDESVANADTLVSWEWNFGDGNSSALKDPCHTYNGGGEFEVTLTVVNSDGCISELYIDTIFVSTAPEVNFSYNQICFGDTTFFVNLTDTFGFQIDTLLWTFGDTASTNNTSTQYDPFHIFSNPGQYDVTLYVGNIFGCTDSLIQTIVVDSLPEANFTMPDTISRGATFELIDQSVANGSPIFTWVWDFGDGTSGTNINPINHAYNQIGDYFVCLTVTDFNGCSDQYCDTILVIGPPGADFSYASDTTLETFFTDKSEPVDHIIGWKWNFGDPNTTMDTISGEPNPVWQFSEEGWYNVLLEVEDKFQGIHDTTKLIYAGNAVSAEFNQYGQCVGDTTFFIDLSNSPLVTEFDRWYWDFGDGTDTLYFNQVDTLMHYYAFPGNYIVKFAVSDTINGFFMTDTITKLVSVFESPVAKIDTSGLDVCFGQTIQFDDVTAAILDPIVDWVWDFNTPEGDSAFIKNPEFLYADTGTYHVKMTVATEKGCSSIDSVLAHVNYAPQFGFIVENNCVNSPAFFIPDYDSSAATITEWFWDFGDNLSQNNTSTLARPSHVYERVQEYTVTMTMEAYSCPGETEQTFLVYPIPFSEFTVQENFGGVQGRVKFTNSSIYATSYLWDFGNGNTSTVPDPLEVYEFDSTYTVTLTSYNEYFCSDTSYAEITIFFNGLYFPTAFSPNNPNDEISRFTPKGINLKEYLVQVFDQRGNLMWESDKLDEAGSPVESWDGYYDGKLMPQGTYIWRAAGKFRDGSVWQGQSFDDADPQTTGIITMIR